MFLCPGEVFDDKKKNLREVVVLHFHFMGKCGLHLTKGII